MADLVELVDSLDLVIVRAEGLLPPEQLRSARELAAHFRSRRTLLHDTLIIAIAGGTGAGKSSVLNALAGRRLASVSPLRPHTDLPLAWVPDAANASLSALLDDLGIAERKSEGNLNGVAVVDLPDLDSVAEWHRHSVEQLLPRVDLVIWVVDPVKYRDRGLHQDFLVPLAPYRRQFVFALNQIDRLQPEDVPLVERHFRSTLIVDGYQEPTLFPIAADPDIGPPQGIGALRAYLIGQTEAKAAVMDKLVIDISTAARDLGMAAGTWRGWSLGLEERWNKTRRRAMEALVGGDGALFDAAAGAIAELLATLGFEAGPATRERIIEETAGWRAALGAAAERQDEAEATGMLNRAIGDGLRDALAGRALLGASVAHLGVEAARAEANLEREGLSG